MNTESIYYCPLCGQQAQRNLYSSLLHITCPNCGSFLIQDDSVFWLGQAVGMAKHGNMYYYNNPKDDEDFKQQLIVLSSFIALYNENSDNKPMVSLDLDFIKRVLNSSSIPHTPEEKADAILNHVNSHSSYFGEFIPVLPKVLFSDNDIELTGLIKELESEGFIKQRQSIFIETKQGSIKRQHYEVAITLKGIEYIKEKKINSKKDKCFIAMWFNLLTDKIFKEVIKPVCEEAGYKPIRVDKLQFNDDITDHIIAEIKESFFVISDLTGFRGGVYYEAGFARGLGKEVIFCCKKDYEIKIQYGEDEELKSEKGPHFDVNHINILFWEANKLNDFKHRLKDRILATVGRGTYIREDIARQDS